MKASNYVRAAVWARYMAAALPAVCDPTERFPHLADHAARAARLADFALTEYLKRFNNSDVKGAE